MKEKELVDRYGLEYDSLNKSWNSRYSIILKPDCVQDGELVLKFGKINGNFNCENLDIKSFKNFPYYIHGSLFLHSNNLEELDGMPKYVKNDIYISGNNKIMLPIKVGYHTSYKWSLSIHFHHLYY